MNALLWGQSNITFWLMNEEKKRNENNGQLRIIEQITTGT